MMITCCYVNRLQTNVIYQNLEHQIWSGATCEAFLDHFQSGFGTEIIAKYAREFSIILKQRKRK